MEYTAVIRTLGTAGSKYQKLLDSLVAQTLRPSKIIVYIAEGYPLPKETVGIEEYIYVKKGMVAQRALQYKEVNTEYILFLDDDLVLHAEAEDRDGKQRHNNRGEHARGVKRRWVDGEVLAKRCEHESDGREQARRDGIDLERLAHVVTDADGRNKAEGAKRHVGDR